MNKFFDENNLENINKKLDLLDIVKSGIYYDSARALSETESALTPDIINNYYIDNYRAASLLTVDFFIFCKHCYDVNNMDYSIGDSSVRDILCSNDNVCYLNNQLSEKAFSVFSRYLSQSSRKPLISFKDLVEELNLGESKYAIIPVSSSADGQLISFRNMIVNNDFKISIETDIYTENDGFTRFALVQKNLCPPYNKNNCKLLFSLLFSENEHINDFLIALDYHHIDVLSINSVINNESDGPLYYIEVSVNENTCNMLSFFLECSRSRYNILGYYYHI